MLGVTIANDFTATAHVTELTTYCAQTQYALRVLRAHRLNDDALQSVFRSVVLARLLYAASAWHGLSRASDQRRIDALFHRARRQGYCSPDLPTLEELCDFADDELFGKAVRLSNHILHDLLTYLHLPPRRNITNSGTARIHYNCLNIPHTCQTATFLHACYIKHLLVT